MLVAVSDYKAKRKKLFLCPWQQQFPWVGRDESIPYDLTAISVKANRAGSILKAPIITAHNTHTDDASDEAAAAAASQAKQLDDTTS